jgi:hypothetical protein
MVSARDGQAEAQRRVAWLEHELVVTQGALDSAQPRLSASRQALSQLAASGECGMRRHMSCAQQHAATRAPSTDLVSLWTTASGLPPALLPVALR